MGEAERRGAAAPDAADAAAAALCAIGVDIGGTNVKAGWVDADGRLRRSLRAPTDPERGADALFGKVLRLVKALRRDAEDAGMSVAGIGVGTAGQVDARRNAIVSATPNLPGWAGYPLAERLSARTGLPVAVDNDANMLAAGEAWAGAGRIWSDFVCVTLGTGVGGCLVLGGRPYAGRSGFAGEFGHLVVHAGGRPCNCGRSGCWEQYASVTALRRMIAEQGPGLGADSPEALFAAARSGDEAAAALVDAYARQVAIGLGNLVHAFDPQAIVIGGAVTAQGDVLFDRIRAALRAEVMPAYVREPLPVVPAALGNEAGVVGAAAAALAAQAAQQPERR